MRLSDSRLIMKAHVMCPSTTSNARPEMRPLSKRPDSASYNLVIRLRLIATVLWSMVRPMKVVCVLAISISWT